MLLQLKRWFNQTCAPGTDNAFASWPVPDGCRIVQQQGDCKLVTAASIDLADAVIYGIQGWVLRTDDDNTDFLNMNTLWDSMVPKPSANAILDQNLTADTGAVDEPGQISIAQVFDQELMGPERIYMREKLLALHDTPIGFVPGSPSVFHPADSFRITDNKSYKVKMGNAGLVYAISSPDLAGITDDDNDVMTGLGSTQGGFYVMKYLEEFLDKALVDLVGIHETGAESPYEDVMIWLIDLLERSAVISGVGAFTAITWNIIGKMTTGIVVPGRFNHSVIGPSGQA